ncbi:tRNA (N6-threonylcarbamoyladenosine(37)-N6)-methyltransferase TrmO [Marinomonas arenicola]|uniref:tRNA (N6-threonylcarbamoyladenosine(37)-N6)-methyltransferase TrmO n=1 Tax=Marinomonas arenicola TaxID=569601 RepID=A0ABU9G2R8_9GAMM
MSAPTHFNLTTIGLVHSCYKEKFGIPRQPGLVTEATAKIELLPPFNRLDTLDGLSDFSHIWVQFIFHATMTENWKAKIRPPRLGGKVKMGVFATRATHRPNPIGLSVIKLGNIYQEKGKVFIELLGADLLDGTPVLDIKPYIPYADSIPDAQGGFAPQADRTSEVVFSELADRQCNHYQSLHQRDIKTLIKQVIEQDPRPSYLQQKDGKEHGIKLWDLNIRWRAHPEYFEILHIEQTE